MTKSAPNEKHSYHEFVRVQGPEVAFWCGECNQACEILSRSKPSPWLAREEAFFLIGCSKCRRLAEVPRRFVISEECRALHTENVTPRFFSYLLEVYYSGSPEWLVERMRVMGSAENAVNEFLGGEALVKR